MMMALSISLSGTLAASQEAVEPETAAETAAPADEPASAAQATPDLDAPQTEQDSVDRIYQEISELLTEEGRPVTPGDTAVADKLADLATRCGVLANNVRSDDARAVLLSCQARVIAALTQLDPADLAATEKAEEQFKHLRETGEQIRSLARPDSQPASDYWKLTADLAEISRSKASIGLRQSLARQMLGDYIDHYAKSQQAGDFVIDARLSLASLLDECGNQQAAAEQLEAIGEVDQASPRFPAYSRLENRAQRIGKAIQIEGVTTSAQRWRLSEQEGRPVLVHVYSDSVESSLKMIDAIRSSLTTQTLGGFRIVSLRVGNAIPGSPTPPWPTLSVDLQPGGVIEQMGVDALPTLAWIDQRGHLASIGHTLAVIDRIPVEPKADEPAEELEFAEPGDDAKKDE